jgi:hypothetical protein
MDQKWVSKNKCFSETQSWPAGGDRWKVIREITIFWVATGGKLSTNLFLDGDRRKVIREITFFLGGDRRRVIRP